MYGRLTLSFSRKICILFTKTLGDAFPAEILKLSPPCLQKLDFRGSPSLSQFLCAPSNSCICLRQVNLTNCDSLSFVLVQSRSIEFFDLSDCPRLKKVLVQCKSLGTLAVRGCSSLCTLMTWSESLENLDLSTCSALSHLDLICPKLSRRTLYLPDGCSLCTTAKANCRVAKFLWETSNGSRVGGENSIESIKTSGDDFDYFRYSKS